MGAIVGVVAGVASFAVAQVLPATDFIQSGSTITAQPMRDMFLAIDGALADLGSRLSLFEAALVVDAGSVGIGTDNPQAPQARLDVVGRVLQNGATTIGAFDRTNIPDPLGYRGSFLGALSLEVFNAGNTYAAAFHSITGNTGRDNGTLIALTRSNPAGGLDEENAIGGVDFSGTTEVGSGAITGARIEAVTTEAWSPGANGTRLNFHTSRPGASMDQSVPTVTIGGDDATLHVDSQPGSPEKRLLVGKKGSHGFFEHAYYDFQSGTGFTIFEDTGTAPDEYSMVVEVLFLHAGDANQSGYMKWRLGYGKIVPLHSRVDIPATGELGTTQNTNSIVLVWEGASLKLYIDLLEVPADGRALVTISGIRRR